MQNNLENKSDVKNSSDSLESDESLIRNHSFQTLEQLNYKAKLQENQRRSREKIDENDHRKADEELENNLLSLEITNEIELKVFLNENYTSNLKANLIAQEVFDKNNQIGRRLTQKELKETVNNGLNDNKELSTEDKIKNFTESIRVGKSQTEILQLLITKFKNEEAVSTWVENWRNFQKLHQFAENKLPAEQRAIQNIITKADFTSESAFTASLTEIAQSFEVSNQTKLEISRKFNGAHIFSVAAMDANLKQIKSHKNQIEKEIGAKSREKNVLDAEIDELENEIEKLPLDDPKRKELEQKLEQKKEVLQQTESEIDRLEKGNLKNVSFQLRDGFLAKLNPDGTRSIQILAENFAIKLPSNFLPLTTTKNLRSINLAFPYLALKKLNIADSIFRPNLDNNSVPNKSKRDIGHLILSSLGIDDTRILSEESIKQLKTDLSKLTAKSGKTGRECLIELGIYDVASQSTNKTKLKKALGFIRENKGLHNTSVFEQLKQFQVSL